MILYDQFLISVASVYDEFQNKAGVSGLNPLHYFEGERDRSERKLRHGLIHAVPELYSEKNHMPVDPGYPNHRMYISHDAIQEQVNKGMKWDENYYHPGAKEKMEFVTVADYGARIDAQVGDKVYFHPMVTEPEKFWSIWNDSKLYIAEVHELVCIVRHGQIIPQGGYVLVEPIIKSSEINGLMVDSAPKDEDLKGIVRHSTGVLQPGEEVLFQENANWEFMVEGKRYYAMLEEDICLRCTR